MKSAPAIAFDYNVSRWLVGVVVTVTMMALAALALCGMPWWLKLVAGTAAVLYAAHALRNLLRTRVQRIGWQEAGHWRITDCNGAERTAELQDAIVRGAWLVLTLRCSDKQRFALVLGPDNSDADLRRRLRVRLARRDAEGPTA